MTNMCITFHKGPIGWGVALDGKPVGVIKRIPSVKTYLVSIRGFRPGDGQHRPMRASAAGFDRGEGGYSFPTLKAAKAKVMSVLCPKAGAL